MACLYILLGVLVISTPMGGFLENDNVRVAFSVLLICYGCYRAYSLSQKSKKV